MKVVLLYQHFMVSGVGSTKPYDLARHLRERGHEVTVICGRGYLSQGMDVPRGLVRRLTIDGVNVLCLGVDCRQRMGFARRIWSFLCFTFLAMLMVCRLPRFDVLVASSTPLTVGLVGLAARYIRRRPWVFELRDIWPEFPVRAGYLKNRLLIAISTLFEEWFYREASKITTISDLMRKRLIERGVPADKITFIPTGVDMSAFERAAPDRGWRAAHGLSDALVAVYIGSHGPINGLQYAVDAAAELREEDHIRLVLIGDGKLKPALEAEAARRGLRTIVFLPPVRRSQVPSILKACDVALMLNRMTPGSEYLMPNKFFDYLAAGLPMITNDPAELWNHLAKSECGLLVDAGRPAELAAALRELKADPVRRARMARRSVDLAKESFDRSLLHVQWERLLETASTMPVGRR